ncbi:16992_t:CDS:2 [Dentiscutata erythropus]|uniref:16992_t:CDS:1 n=1 Tax=Dentiscutata erythropus TaxID=1348616 RepID=A0A9N8W3R3_9GLOM|nr:16992_t:CDS:2 [Dentiscutata erythropus]
MNHPNDVPIVNLITNSFSILPCLSTKTVLPLVPGLNKKS